MTLTPETTLRDVLGLSEHQKLRIRDFLHGAVYCWCKNRCDEWFSMRDLMGGANQDWNGTPLIDLYLKQINSGLSEMDAMEQAGKESGWLLKRVISDDTRTFETRIEERIRKYRWFAQE